jgi:hypothetical protein
MKKQLKLTAVAVCAVATGGLCLAFFTAHASPLPPSQRQPSPNAATTPVQPPFAHETCRGSADRPRPVGMSTNDSVLDWRHQFALGMIETGNNDRRIGGAGEVSRYQIMPTVWQHYSTSRNYSNPQVSLAVARQHWAVLYGDFKHQTGREPSDFDMYVLWNTHGGYYSVRNFNPARLAPVVRDRAQRYVNLVQCGDS